MTTTLESRTRVATLRDRMRTFGKADVTAYCTEGYSDHEVNTRAAYAAWKQVVECVKTMTPGELFDAGLSDAHGRLFQEYIQQARRELRLPFNA